MRPTARNTVLGGAPATAPASGGPALRPLQAVQAPPVTTTSLR
jgi:hypothetical protein